MYVRVVARVGRPLPALDLAAVHVLDLDERALRVPRLEPEALEEPQAASTSTATSQAPRLTPCAPLRPRGTPGRLRDARAGRHRESAPSRPWRPAPPRRRLR